VTKTVVLDSPRTAFSVETNDPPRRIVVDRDGWSAKANGGAFSVLTFHADLEHSLIVYGTADDQAANRETAEGLQRAIVERRSNFTVPLKSDREVTDADLKTHHLLLIGGPGCNAVTERFRAALPVTFGSHSFAVRNEAYAHPGSAVIAAADNPSNPRFSLVVLAGLSAEATAQAPAVLMRRDQRKAEVLVLAHGARPRALVVPARDLARDLEGPLTGRK
jgi:hypothetical protein